MHVRTYLQYVETHGLSQDRLLSAMLLDGVKSHGSVCQNLVRSVRLSRRAGLSVLITLPNLQQDTTSAARNTHLI